MDRRWWIAGGLFAALGVGLLVRLLDPGPSLDLDDDAVWRELGRDTHPGEEACLRWSVDTETVDKRTMRTLIEANVADAEMLRLGAAWSVTSDDTHEEDPASEAFTWITRRASLVQAIGLTLRRDAFAVEIAHKVEPVVALIEAAPSLEQEADPERVDALRSIWKRDPNWFGRQHREAHAVAKQRMTEVRMDRLRRFLLVHAEEHRQLPTSLRHLAQGADVRDGWGGLINYDLVQPEGGRLTSFGPDGVQGGGDDLGVVVPSELVVRRPRQ